MTVDYFSYLPGLGKGNLLFVGEKHPMRNGKFPRSHPCADNPKPMVFSHDDQPVSDDPLGKFRARGYEASCFPEGDGICFVPPEGWATPGVVKDVEECFGWKVKVRRA